MRGKGGEEDSGRRGRAINAMRRHARRKTTAKVRFIRTS